MFARLSNRVAGFAVIALILLSCLYCARLTVGVPIDALDVWMPLSSHPNFNSERRDRSYMVFGRVADHVSFEQAASELRSVAASLATAYPEANANWSARFDRFDDVAVQFVGRNLKMLSGAVALVLLIACANIANLLLVRASGRQREMALRTALGASRVRLVRQLVAESVLMAIAGGALGLVLGAALTDAMLALVPNLPRAAHAVRLFRPLEHKTVSNRRAPRKQG